MMTLARPLMLLLPYILHFIIVVNCSKLVEPLSTLVQRIVLIKCKEMIYAHLLPLPDHLCKALDGLSPS
jgi:hypothetical protein